MAKLSQQIMMGQGLLKTEADMAALIEVPNGETYCLTDEQIALAHQKSLADFDAMEARAREQRYYNAKTCNEIVITF